MSGRMADWLRYGTCDHVHAQYSAAFSRDIVIQFIPASGVPAVSVHRYSCPAEIWFRKRTKYPLSDLWRNRSRHPVSFKTTCISQSQYNRFLTNNSFTSTLYLIHNHLQHRLLCPVICLQQAYYDEEGILNNQKNA